MKCELCGAEIPYGTPPGAPFHWSCLEKILDAATACPQSPVEFARRCPDIAPGQRGSGRIIRKQTT